MPRNSRDERNYGSRSSVTAWFAIGVASLVGFGVLHTLLSPGQQQSAAERQAMKDAAAGMQGDLRKIEDQVDLSKGTPHPIQPLTFDPGAAHDPATVFRSFMTSMLNQEIAQRNAYLAELQAAGWPKALDPDRIQADPTMAQSLKISADAKVIVEKYRARTHALVTSIRNQMQALDVSPEQRQQILSGFDRSSANDPTAIDDQWNLEASLVTEADGIFKLLHDRKGRWRVVDRKIMFRDPADLGAFRTHLAAIKQIGDAEKRLQAEHMAKANAAFDGMQ